MFFVIKIFKSFVHFQVFKKFGVEKYDPINEEFDPNRHNAVFQVPDETKSPDTVAVVLKVPDETQPNLL